MKIEEFINQNLRNISKDTDLLNLIYNKLKLTTGVVEKYDNKNKNMLVVRLETEEGIKEFEITSSSNKSITITDRTIVDVLRTSYTFSNNRKVLIKKTGRYEYGIRIDETKEEWNKSLDSVKTNTTIKTFSKSLMEKTFSTRYEDIFMKEEVNRRLDSLTINNEGNFCVNIGYEKDFRFGNDLTLTSFSDSRKNRIDCRKFNSAAAEFNIKTVDDVLNVFNLDEHYVDNINLGTLQDSVKLILTRKALNFTKRIDKDFFCFFEDKYDFALAIATLLTNRFEILDYEHRTEEGEETAIINVKKDNEFKTLKLKGDKKTFSIIELNKDNNSEYYVRMANQNANWVIQELITENYLLGIEQQLTQYNDNLRKYSTIRHIYDKNLLEELCGKDYKSFLSRNYGYSLIGKLKESKKNHSHSIAIGNKKLYELIAFGSHVDDLDEINRKIKSELTFDINAMIRILKIKKAIPVTSFDIGPKYAEGEVEFERSFGKGIMRSRRKK